MPAQQQRGEAWSTQNIVTEGGLYINRDTLFQAEQMPGSAISLINMEPSLDGGYHRILGYEKFDTNQLPNGTSQVFGLVVSHFEDSVIAMQGGDTFRGSGSGWTKISGTDNHAGMGHVEHTDYDWATSRFTFVDGDPAAYPVRVEAGGTYTVLTNAPTGQKFVREFQGYLWLSSGNSTVTFSAPDNDNDYNAGDGAGTINVGFNIQGMAAWRGALYILGDQRIAQITGTSAADWTVTLLTDQIGMTGVYSLQEVNGDLLFLSDDGIRTISGTARIFDRELGVISRPIAPIITAMGGANLTSTTVRTKSQYRLFQATSSTLGGTAPGIIGTLRLQTNGSTAWEWAQISGIAVSCADDGLFNGVELVVHGAWDGYVYKQESGTDFNGTAIQATYQSPHLVFSDPSIRKILQKISVNTKASGNATINLGLIFDLGNINVALPPGRLITLAGGSGVWDGAGETWDSGTLVWDITPYARNLVNINGSGFTCSFLFTSSGGEDYSITSWSPQFSIGARR